MDEWYAVEGAMALGDGEMTEVTIAGTPVLIGRVGDEYFATQALCPHLRARLARGRLEGHIIVCPSHGSRFDIRDGKNTDWTPGLPSLVRNIARAVSKPSNLRVYATRIEDEQLLVELG